MSRIFYSLLWGLLFPLLLFAQSAPLPIEHISIRDTVGRPALIRFGQITTEQGIPKGVPRTAFRDSKGFLWIAISGQGVLRYDGRQVRSFPPSAVDSTGFPATIFFGVGEDSKGILWFGTELGLVRFDPVTEHFRLILNPSVKSNYMSELIVDKQDRIWLQYRDGLTLYDPPQDLFSSCSIPSLMDGITGLPSQLTPPSIVSTPTLEPNGTIWMNGTFPNGQIVLLQHNPTSGEWRVFPFPAGGAYRIAVQQGGKQIWCWNWQTHLWQLDLVKKKWTQYKLDKVGIDSSITSVIPDDNNGLWFTDARGITGYLDLRKFEVSKYLPEPGKRTAPMGLSLMLNYIFTDQEGTIWWPSARGIYSLNPKRQWLKHNLPPKFTPLPNTDDFEAIYYDTLSQSFFGTMPTSGKRWRIVRMDKEGQTFVTELESTAPIRSIIRFKDKIILGHQGISLLDPRTMQVNHLVLPIANRRDLNTDSLYFQRKPDLLRNGDMILPTNIEQLLYLRSDGKTCFLIPIRCGALLQSALFEAGVVEIDKQDNVWVGTSKGVIKLQFLAQSNASLNEVPRYSLTHFWLLPKTKAPEEINFVNWMDSTPGDSLWISSSTGLFCLPSAAMSCQRIPKINYYCGRLFCDRKGMVWFKSTAGIERYNPKTDRLEIFDEQEGIEGELYDRLFYSDDGTFFFRGAYRWRPEQIPEKNSPPPLAFTSFKVFETEFHLDSSINYISAIRLKSSQNFFTIGFAALDLERPDKCEYAYQLSNVDTGWVHCGKRNTASYTNLAPGDYVFRVKACNSSGIWSGTPRYIHIHIIPEWYQTIYFKLALAAFLLGLIIFYYQNRLAKAALQARLLREQAEREKTEATLKTREEAFRRQLAETEMAALRAQMNPHFIFNCLNSIKLYTEENDTKTASFFLTKFARLIRRVLENSRSEKVSLDNELEALELYMQLEAMRFKGKVKYKITVDEALEGQFIQIPPLLLQPFVENAIWHGLMQKIGGGSVEIRIMLHQEQSLLIEIEDDGIGRAKAAALKSKTATWQKSLGMQVTSERIEAINQLYQIKTTVEVSDLFDQNGAPRGTLVTLLIPI